MKGLLEDIEVMRSSGYDPSTIADAEARNELIEAVLDSPIGDHLRSIEEQGDVLVSGGSLFGASSIKESITEYHPEAFLFPRGYFPIWGCDGNIIVYGLKQRKFYWAWSDSWFPDCDLIVIPVTHQTLPYTEADVPRALIELSDDPPQKFIGELIAGLYDEQLRKLG